jgi:hypothetical protein
MFFKFQQSFKIILFVTVLMTIQACHKSTEPEQNEPPKRLKLYINEFMASNKSTIADEKNQFDDWVELYNGEDTTVNLSLFYLTDDFTRKNKWRMPNFNLQPKKWILIWCDEDSAQGILHSNFKLSSAGEQIGIFSLSLEVIDTITYGPQKTDTSFGRFPDGADFWKFMNPTPNSSNK